VHVLKFKPSNRLLANPPLPHGKLLVISASGLSRNTSLQIKTA